MFRIRLHGRGGQGVKTAGQVLGTAFFLEGFEVQDAPRYGAERRGAPIVSYVRASHVPILERGVIARPDLVVVADDTLVPLPTAGVLPGVSARTTLLIASGEPATAWRARLGLEGPVLAIAPDVDPALRTLACAAAGARLVGAISRTTLERALERELPGGASARAAATALEAFDAMASHAGTVSPGAAHSAADYVAPEWIDLPADPADLAAPDIRAAATSTLSKTGTWRTMRPVIDAALCRRCAWVCSTFCPDSAIAVDEDRTPRIDYDHCKGCMVCVAVCPPHAIRAVPERGAST